MIRIDEIKQIDKKRIALIDTSSISFMQGLKHNGINPDSVLRDYELILIPKWVLIEIEDSADRSSYVQNLIDEGYPIYYIAEETYTDLAGYEEGNLYQIVLASTFRIASIRSYLRRHVQNKDALDMESYATWINRLYEEWPIQGEELSSGRIRKKNAGEVSITILAEVLSWYYPETEWLTVYSQDSDTYEFQRNAEDSLREFFASRTPVPISCKSNDAILCQLFRKGVMNEDDIKQYRKDARRITYGREQSDHSVVLVTKHFENEDFVKLIKDEAVHIIF